jgi:phosphoglycolate phosphatase
MPAPPLAAFVTDLDRTLLPPGGRPTRSGRHALAVARSLGLKTVLVSGREYGKLGALARGFGGWDALVAEDGAVVEAPFGRAPVVQGGSRSAAVRRRLAQPPELGGDWGDVIVSLPRSERARLARRLDGLAVHLVANVDRIMVVPDGVSKRAGVRRALRQLGLAGQPYAAIGDAENDVTMLEGAALAGTVANARPGVRRVVDFVADGEFDSGVEEFVLGPVRDRMERAA